MANPALKLCVLAVALACLGNAAAQSRFIWTDENGRKVYSDNPPPPSVPKTRILKGIDQLGKAPPPAVVATSTTDSKGVAKDGKEGKAKGPMTLAEREAESKKSAKDAAEKAKERDAKAESEKAQAERCGQLKAYLASLETGGRINKANASGEREFLDDTARVAETTKTKDAIAKECK